MMMTRKKRRMKAGSVSDEDADPALSLHHLCLWLFVFAPDLHHHHHHLHLPALFVILVLLPHLHCRHHHFLLLPPPRPCVGECAFAFVIHSSCRLSMTCSSRRTKRNRDRHNMPPKGKKRQKEVKLKKKRSGNQRKTLSRMSHQEMKILIPLLILLRTHGKTTVQIDQVVLSLDRSIDVGDFTTKFHTH